MSEKDTIWSYLTYQNTNDIDPDNWYDDQDPDTRPTSFQKYLQTSAMFSTKCQFIVIGKVLDYRGEHPELRPWRSGYICFYSLNFMFEAKNIEILVSLQQLLQVPPTTKLIPQITKYPGTKKDAFEDMDRYFKQYNHHVTIKGVHFVILNRHDFDYVRQFFAKINTYWIDHQYEKWERVRPKNLISDDDD
jgi:hypothetical protein